MPRLTASAARPAREGCPPVQLVTRTTSGVGTPGLLLKEGPDPMAETPANESRQIQLRIDESKMNSTYANTIRTSTTNDEVVLDFGMNLPVPGADNNPVLVFAVGSRVIMNWAAAKRLAISLGQVVRQFEERNGTIELNQPGAAGKSGGDKPKLSN
ncbi:MAG: DUF3467 domain-containing protein [Phycisphaerales bacterium]|nr:MAG: DUF3467 domain-containing protein [Phycisphaerales bacterium]